MNITTAEYAQRMAQALRSGAWELEGITDIADEDGDGYSMESCGFCGTAIRYVHHVVSPPEVGEELEVGCCCSMRLCGSEAPREAEKQFRSQQKKRERLFDRTRWGRSSKGNWCTKIRGRGYVTLFKEGRGWCAVASGQFTKCYPERIDAVKEAAKILYP
jgi:hypothetical protein